MEHTFPVMQSDSHARELLRLVRQKGVLRSRDLNTTTIPRVYLSRLIATGQLERAGRGLYRRPSAAMSESESMVTVATRVPKAIFCLMTALQFHELTTQLPRQVWIAMPRGSHAPKIDYPPLKMVQFSGDAYEYGVEVFVRDKVKLRVYGVAKTIADCFKHRNKIGLDVALEALKNARAQKKASAEHLWHFSKICRVANVMRPYLEAIG